MRDKLRFPKVRVGLLSGILVAECYAISLHPHPSQSALRPVSLSAFFVPFCATLVVFGRQRAKSLQSTLPAPNLGWAALHSLTLCLIAWLLFVPLRNDLTGTAYPPAGLLGWYGLIVAMVGTAVLALFPGLSMLRLCRNLGWAWLYAVLAAALGLFLRPLLQNSWNLPGAWLGHGLQITAFIGAQHLLGLFHIQTVADPSQFTLGTGRFMVQIMGLCSGAEGLTLMLVLVAAWLIYMRRELHLWRALLLLPASLLAVWLMNIVRIAALIAIGNAGYEDVAMQGFHSVTGWLLFNAVALGFLLATQHVRWFRKDSIDASAAHAKVGRYAAAPYLLPFLAVLLASMIGRAATSGFDWSYPLRPLVALAVLGWYRADYLRMNWRFGWRGLATGGAVFALWFALARWQHASGAALSAELARLAAWQRVSWIAARVLGAVITVPLVEELAFRGYLARRIQSPDVEAVPFTQMPLLGILLSSLAFGAMHGPMWIAGTVAGVLFAGVAKLRGTLGEAVAAHATANLLIAVFTMYSGDYSMWS